MFLACCRVQGIPARYVSGYLYSDDSEHVANHAWAEVWEAGKGWVRVDPTGAVAPGRVGQSMRLVQEPGLFAGAVIAMSPTFAQNLRATWEAVNNGWNQWVLNYTQSRQLDLLKNIGFEAPSLEDLAYVLLYLLVLLLERLFITQDARIQ